MAGAGVNSFLFASGEIDSQPVPETPTLLFPRTCRILEIDIVNPTESAITVTIQNNNGDPVWIVFQIAPSGAAGNPMMTYRSQVGKKMTGGVIWYASAPGLVGSMCVRL